MVKNINPIKYEIVSVKVCLTNPIWKIYITKKSLVSMQRISLD